MFYLSLDFIRQYEALFSTRINIEDTFTLKTKLKDLFILSQCIIGATAENGFNNNNIRSIHFVEFNSSMLGYKYKNGYMIPKKYHS